MHKSDFKKIADTIPHQPGIYQFLDDTGNILYVGKAKDLRKRLASYFGNKKHQRYKISLMVRSAAELKYTIVGSEQDALLLENGLIKKHQPRFNVTWRDDKSYSYICVKKERFPRVFLTRKVIRDGSTYFGPYTSKARVKIILDIIKKLFPLRTCSYYLSEENIAAGKFKVCLEYHIKNCLGPCIGLETEEEYNIKIGQVKNILKGHFKEVRSHLSTQMAGHAQDLNFEKAQDIKDRLSVFEDYQSKSTIVSKHVKDVDVFSIATDDKYAYVNFLKVTNGAIIHAHTMEMTKNLNDDERQLLSIGVQNLREKYRSSTLEIVLPMSIKLVDQEITITIPKRGEKKQLIELSKKNVKHYLFRKQQEKLNRRKREASSERILRTLQDDLNMDKVPLHIECFDNSNMQGSHPVASCVVFKNAKPSKRDYRHFNIKTVTGINDFASMEEIVHRRYRRLLDEDESLPDLVIVDGGKGQLSAAVQSLETLGIFDKITIIGIAKRLEEIYFPGDSIPLYINKKSESLKLIQQLRNEAHRFAITFHRDKRSKAFTKTELTEIQGIGEKTAQKLLKHFKSVKKIQKATLKELADVCGNAAANKVFQHFKNK